MDQLPDEAGKNRDYQVGYKKPPLETRFGPGNNANPGGRPKGRSITARLRELIESGAIGGKPLPEGKQVADLLAETVLKGCLKGDFRFLKEALDRLEGKVTDKLEVASTSDVPIVVINVGGKATLDDL